MAALALSVWSWPTSASATTDSIPGSLWTVPMSVPGGTGTTPTGAVLVASCQTQNNNPLELAVERLTPTGSMSWQLLRAGVDTSVCPGLIGDNQDYTYIQGKDSKGNPVARSITPTGQVRWTASTGDGTAWRDPPVFGANGSVFFETFDGLHTSIYGFDRNSGAETFHQSPSPIHGLHAYDSGLAEVNEDNSVSYVGYDGMPKGTVGPVPAVSNDFSSSNISSGDGTVFIAGYEANCFDTEAHLSVTKITPSGVAWTWTDPSVTCGVPSLAATPDGGVAVMTVNTTDEVEAISLDPLGHFRWRQSFVGLSNDIGFAYTYEVFSDVHGVLALQLHYEYPDPLEPSINRTGVEDRFLSTQDGATAFPTVSVAVPNGDYKTALGTSIGANRVYLTRHSLTSPSASAFQVAGLGQDYQTALETANLAVTTTESPQIDPTNTDTTSDSPAPPAPSAPTNPCRTVRGNFAKRLLAAARCAWIRNQTKIECGVGVAGWLSLPLKSLRLAKTASGLLNVEKIAKPLQPVARLYNTLSLAKYTKRAPRGFRTFPETKKTIKRVKRVNKLVELLPDLKRALSARDFHQVALDIAEITALKPCVVLMARLIAS
jgi:hypothetical protein